MKRKSILDFYFVLDVRGERLVDVVEYIFATDSLVYFAVLFIIRETFYSFGHILKLSVISAYMNNYYVSV